MERLSLLLPQELLHSAALYIQNNSFRSRQYLICYFIWYIIFIIDALQHYPTVLLSMQSDRSAVALQRQDGRVSSSPALSTPPDSPVSFTHPQHHGSLGKNPRPLPDGVDFSHDLSPSQQRLAPASNTAASANALTITENNNYNKFNLNTNNKSTTASVKKPRKKREQPAADANVEDRPKEKKARKPREPRNQQNQHRDALAQKDPAQKTMVPTQNGGEITLSSNNVASNSYPHTTSAVARTSPETLRPASSGQHFDPVRSVSIEAGSSASKAMNSTSPAPAVRSPPARTGSTASATASIHSLIDPFPALSSSSVATKSTLPSLSSNGARQPSTVGSNPLSPSRQSHAFGMLASASTSTSNTAMPKPATPQHSALSANGRMTPTKKVDAAVAPPSDAVPGPQDSMAMEIDTPATANTNAAMLPAKTPDAPSTHNGATPPSSKSNRQKEVSLPPLPGTSGTGLLNPASAPPNGAYAVNICLHFDLRGKESLTFSFAREVEKKYGRDALHPRRAAHRDRMARMAAATAALEKDSSVAGGSGSAQDGSDLSELDQDNDQEMEIDSNAEGGPMDGAANGNFDANSGLKTGRGSRRKRRPNKNEYNLDDDFIDDAELAWEEQAAVATGGFFVYSGPLVPEGEKPAVERYVGILIYSPWDHSYYNSSNFILYVIHITITTVIIYSSCHIFFFFFSIISLRCLPGYMAQSVKPRPAYTLSSIAILLSHLGSRLILWFLFRTRDDSTF